MRRARTLSTLLGFLLVAVYAIRHLNPGARGLGTLQEQVKNPGWVFIGLLTLTLLTPALGVVDRYWLSRALDATPVLPPPELKEASWKLRTLAFGMWIGVAVFAAASTHDLARYSDMTATELRILPIAPAVTAALFCIVAAALAAGYRFSLGIWSIIILAGYWASYLPGYSTDYMLFIDFSAVIFLVILTFAYRFRARPLVISGAQWPIYRSGGETIAA